MDTVCTSYGSKLYNNKTCCGPLDSVHLLDTGHCMYMDNFYTSPELYEELFSIPHMPVVQCTQIGRACQKQ